MEMVWRCNFDFVVFVIVGIIVISCCAIGADGSSYYDYMDEERSVIHRQLRMNGSLSSSSLRQRSNGLNEQLADFDNSIKKKEMSWNDFVQLPHQFPRTRQILHRHTQQLRTCSITGHINTHSSSNSNNISKCIDVSELFVRSISLFIDFFWRQHASDEYLHKWRSRKVQQELCEKNANSKVSK